jgi:hypothetical protein
LIGTFDGVVHRREIPVGDTVALAAKATPPDVTVAVVGSVGGLAAFALARRECRPEH